MSFARIVLYALGLLLLTVLAAGYYYYRNFPALVEEQARRYLEDYGVQTLTYEGLAISREQLQVATLRVSGEYQGLGYSANLNSLTIRFEWRMLRAREIESVTLDSLKLMLDRRTPRAVADPPVALELASLLPQPYIADLPIKTLDIRQWAVDYQQANLPPLNAAGSLRVEEQVQLTFDSSLEATKLTVALRTDGEQRLPTLKLQLADGDISVAAVAATLESADAGQWHWSLDGRADFAPLLGWLKRMAPEYALPIDFDTLEGLVIAGSSEFDVALTHPATLPPDDSEILEQLDIVANTRNHLERLDYPATVSKLAGDLALSVGLSAGEISLSIAPTELQGILTTQLLSLPESMTTWLHWHDTVSFQWRSPETITLAPEQDTWTVQLRDNLLVLGDRNSQLRWEKLDLRAAATLADPSRLELDLSSRLHTRLRREQLPQLKVTLNGDGTLADSRFSLSVEDVAQSMNLALRGTANLQSGKGDYKLRLGSQDLAYASSTTIPLLQKFALLSKRDIIEISRGTMRLESRLHSEAFNAQAVTQQSQLTIAGLAGIYDEYRFESLKLTADWTGIETVQTRAPVALDIGRLDVGFDLLDTQLRLSLPRATPLREPVVNIDSLTSNVFGGRVFLPEPQRWDFGAADNSFTVRAERWQLADMVALQQGQDIKAQGTLEGELPVTVSDGRIIIANGFLRAIAPGGTIRYVANESSVALAASSSELALALDLLSDFQYKVLSSRVELDKVGNLRLGLSLEGKNPTLFEGRPINFNINLEQNLDPLLQSLRLSDKLVEKLQGRIK